jgi:hypothetical protein
MNQYLEPAPEAPTNPYLDTLRGAAERDTSRLRASAGLALDANPDEVARNKRTASLLGVPLAAVEALPKESDRNARLRGLEQTTANAPVLRSKFTDQDFARLAHDDADNLSAIEKVVRSTWQFTRSTAAGIQGMPADLVYGGGRAAFDFVAPVLDPLVGRVLPENPIRRVASGFADLQGHGQATSQRIQGDVSKLGFVEGAVNQGARSLGGNLIALPLGLVGGARAALTPIVGSEFGRSYGSARDKGLQPFEAGAYGASQAAIEYATEKLPVKWLLGDIKAGASFARTLGRQALAEVPGEQAATLLQDLNDWAALNPDKSLRSFIDNYADPSVRGSAALQTLIATLVGVGGQTTIVKGIDTAMQRFDGEQQRAQAAQSDAQALGKLTELAAESKVRPRDPQTFEQFVKAATAEAQVQDVFIPAETLAQALGPNLDAVVDQVPGLREQFDEGLATGGLLSIPVEQFAAYVPTELAQALVPHLRTGPEAMSLSEAQTFAQEGQAQLQAEIDTLAGPPADAAPAQVDPVDVVRGAIGGLLKSTGRFTGDVNSAYGELLTRFFQATAERMGLDIQALYQEYGPRIVSQISEAPGQLDQPEGAAPTGDPKQSAAPRRGAYDPASRTIALLPQADLSTFIHEAGHYFLEVQTELAIRADAPMSMLHDMEAVLSWFGVKNIAEWRAMTLEQKRPHHEKFARGFEAYAFEGEAPSQELQGVFRRFRSWLVRVYRQMSALNVELSPEVRAVFGRMLASEQQITDAEAMRSYRPLFDSAEAAGMTAKEWDDYQATGAQATADAVESLEQRSIRDMQWLANARARALNKLQRTARAQRALVEAEVTAELQQMPQYAAQRWLKTGMLPDGTQTVGAKLSTKALAEMYGDGPATPRRYLSTDMVAAEGGMHPDQVAEIFVDAQGVPAFDSGDALVRAIVAAGKESDAIEGITDQRMLERHGDLIDDRAVARAADELIHNEARARFLEREVNTLARAVGNRPVVARAARQYAEQAIAQKKVHQIRPSQFTAAEARAAKAAEQAFKKGDIATAAARKREQLLQNQLARVAHRAVGEAQRAVDYLAKFDTANTRKAIGADYADQIEALLERFDLRTSTSLKDIARRKSLAEWVEQQRAQGLEPAIDERLLTDAARVSFKELTLEDLRGLVDSVKNIEHLGRLKQKLLTVQDQRRFDELVTEVSQSIIEHGGKRQPVALEGRTGVVPWLQGVWASHRKISSLVRQMDGGKDAGPLWRVLVRGMNDAGNREQRLTETATLRLAALYAPMLKMRGGINGAKIHIPEIGASLSRGGRLAVALNWGNAANRQRLVDGEGWTEEQVGAVLRTLTRSELQFVNQVWEFLDSYWPEVSAKQFRVDGVTPSKVEAEPFSIALADGSSVAMRGGYYPIKYDLDRSNRAEAHEAGEVARDMLRGAYTRATTRRGHTKARADLVERPLRKDLDVITQHVTQVVHDLSWHEWLIDANRLLSAKSIDYAIRTHYGPEVVRTLKDDIQGIAAGDLVSQTHIDRALLTLRTNVSRSTMGLSFTTAMLQPFGLLQSMARIGVKPTMRGMARWVGDAARLENSMGWIGEKSDFMRLRTKTFNRELSEIRGKVAGQSKAAQLRDGVLFFMTTKMQMVADVPTWIGRYELAIADGINEATAVALADQAVIDSQGGGTTKDLAEVQRRHPFLTSFYSYFSTTLNLVAENTGTTDFRNPRAVAGWLGDMALLMVLPALGTALALSALRGDDDDELGKQLLQAQAGYLLGMVVLARELSGLVSGYAYSGPPVSRIVTDAGKAADQFSQGEIDEPAVLATVRLLGTAFGIPTVQAVRSYRGWLAWSEGDAPATSILFGPPAKN